MVAQNPNSFVVLDTIDEQWDEHGRKWIHYSEFPEDDEDMIVVFMLRVVQNTTRVIKSDSTLHDKGPDEHRFSSKRDSYKNGQGYKDGVAAIDAKLKTLSKKRIN